MNESLAFEQQTVGRTGLLRVTGAVDAASEQAFDEQLQKLVAKGLMNLIVSLEKATFLCSAGWGAILTAGRKLGNKGGAVAVVAMPAEIKSIYTMLGMRHVLREFPTEDDALKLLG